MHGWETRMLLRHSLQRGVSKAALARRFGVSRRTIHEWVETGHLDRDLSSGGARYAPRPAVPHKLAPYTGIIEARLEEFPGLSATRLFDEVRAAGYPGGYSRVRDDVRAVRPREPVEAVVRFETPDPPHHARGTGTKHPYGDRRGESVHPRMGWLLSPGHSDRPVRQTGSMDSPAPPQNPVGAMEETEDSVSQNGRTGT